MIWKWVTLLYVLQNVSSLEYGASNLPAGSNRRINNARRKPSRIPSYPLESAIDSGNTQDVHVFFPDVTYPRTVLEAAQPFYYSQQGYDEVLGPFSNDVKSSYKNLGTGNAKIPLNDFSASLPMDHKNDISPNMSAINNNTTDTTFHEIYEYSLRPEDNPVNTEENNTVIVANETVITDSSLYHIDQENIVREIFQDMSEDSHIIDEDFANIKANDIQESNVEENLQWEEVPAMENQMTSAAMKENSPEINMSDRNNNNGSYEEIKNNYKVSDISNIQNDTELLYTKDEINYVNYLLNKIMTSDKILSKHNIEKLDTINTYSVTNDNLTLYGPLSLDTIDNVTLDEIKNFNLYNETNEDDEELINILNSDTIEDTNYNSNDIATLDTRYSLEIKEILDSINNENITYVNLTPNLTTTSDITNNENDTETFYVTTNNYNENIDKDNELLHSGDNNTMQFTMVPNYIEFSTDAITNNEDTETSETKPNEIYVYETPNYVVTSNTGNTREDFVNDIMNIYNLIEETLRAVSVVEFVVSKTLDTLGPKENQNETLTNEFTYETTYSE